MEPGNLLGGRYRLIAQRGLGGSAVVWEAHDEVLDRDVAVKLLATELAGDQALVRRLRVEAQAAARLHHPHVVAVHDFGQAVPADGQPVPYVVLELVDGEPLSEVVASGPLPWRDAVRVAAQVASALAAAHARGIVHRDVKPDNVMLTAGGAKLLDFGISAAVGETDIGPDGELLCTPAYLAPERLDIGPVQAACDVYGLGLLLYKSLTGELPWRWEGMTELLTAHRYVAPAPLPAMPGLPTEVARLCQRCLAKQPADRPSSAEVARELATAGAETAAGDPPARTRHLIVGRGTAPTAPQRATGGRRTSRRRRLLAGAAAGVVLAGVLVGARAAAPVGPGPGSGAGAGAAAEVASCEVRYDIRRDSGGEFAAGLRLSNTGTALVDAWRLEFTFPADQRVLWSSVGVWRQSGQSVAVEGAAPAAALPAGGSVILGFEGSYRDGNPLPTEFHLNGENCTELLIAPAVAAEPDRAQARSADPVQRPAGEVDDRDGDSRGKGSGRGHGTGGGPGRR